MVNNEMPKKSNISWVWAIVLVVIGIIFFRGCINNSPIKADVYVYDTTMQIDNNEDFDLQNPEVIINMSYFYKPSVLRKGTTVIDLRDFVKGDQRLDPYTTVVNKIQLWVSKSPRGTLSGIYK